MAKKKAEADKTLADAFPKKAAPIEAKELELKDGSALQEKLEAAETAAGSSPVFAGRVQDRIAEQLAAEFKKRNEELDKENKTLHTSLKDVTEERDKLRIAFDELKKTQSASSDSLQRDALQLKMENEALQKELNLLKGRLSSSFTSQELASYLNEAITDFNSRIGQSSDTVDYTIGNMDVGLKAQIVKQNDKLGFITTTAEGEAALSEIRFTIAATPRS